MTALELHNVKLKEQARLRRMEYNQNPHICIFCGKPMLMSDSDKYIDIFRKKFCSRACASKYGHKETDKYKKTIYKSARIETDFSDEELILFYHESKSIKDLEDKIGYKGITSQKRVIDRFLNLGLDIFALKNNTTIIAKLTKKELFERNHGYQNARSQIQKMARSIYQNSDRPRQCVICGYDKHYEVAHIKAVSEFDDGVLLSEINNEENLIALCPNHH